MPASRSRAAKRRHALARARENFRVELMSLLREYRAVRGTGFVAERNSARVTEKIVKLFGDVENELELKKFVEQALAAPPVALTACDPEEFSALAHKIAESRSRLSTGRPS